MIKILHTADWHLGRVLYRKQRHTEFAQFLDWLRNVLKEEQINMLIVAGDIFDTTTPSSTFQEMYYRFLSDAAKICDHIVITSGNHDSPSLLDMTKPLLRSMNIHVVGTPPDDLKDEVIVLKKDSTPQAIVCAVPYLREKDLRTVEMGESMEEKNTKILMGLKNHYKQVGDFAVSLEKSYQQQGYSPIPIIMMGHLFAAGGQLSVDDGVRDLYVGNLGQVGSETFPACANYVALGHLHSAQCVNDQSHIRYSGSPIPMSFGEANQTKRVIIVEFEGKVPQIHTKEIPCFQPLVRISGRLDQVLEDIAALKKANSVAWLDLESIELGTAANLNEKIAQSIAGSQLKVLRNRKKEEGGLPQAVSIEPLQNLDPREVFLRRLAQATTSHISQEEREDLLFLYEQVLCELAEIDPNEDEVSP
ncbi:MAG: exonuclease SbcCD subunit D C-terminal domain-containing protein [Spirochaetia bacterium]